ncbi:MAG: hypothetical protein LQ351_006114 [Letrouitia transgressa]|nr:MAG: hypothetical protein LQ351_006114 [Letrouitia transgressa]
MSDKDSSTAKSYLDSTLAAGQSALGSITGSGGDKSEAAARKDQAAAESEASHTVGKLGPFNVSPSGGVSKDDPSRSEGSWNQTLGSAKESLGGLVGSEQLKKEGERQNAEGKGQEAEGQLRDLGSGAQERLKGAVGGAFAGLTGDREKEEEMRIKHDDAKTKQRSAEVDIGKAADA